MSLEALKSVPCPAGDKCNAFHCFFAHPRDATPKEAQVEANGGANSTAKVRKHEEGSDEEGLDEPAHAVPRKRARLGRAGSPARGVGDSPGLSVKTDRSLAHQTGLKRSRQDQIAGPIATRSYSQTSTTASTTMASAHTEHSVKRAAPRASAEKKTDISNTPGPVPAASHRPPDSSSSKSPSKHLSPTPPPGKGSPNAKPSTAKPKPQPKPETLNPRLVKSAPAKHEIRLKLLKLLHAEYARLNNELKASAHGKKHPDLVLSPQQVINLALDDEEKMATMKGAAVYTSAMKHNVMARRKASLGAWFGERQALVTAAKAEAEGGEAHNNPRRTSPKAINTGLTPAQEVTLLQHALTTPISGLAAHGYVPAAPSADAIEASRRGLEAARGYENCDRCSRRFRIFPGRRSDGILADGGVCKHHPGRCVYPPKDPSAIDLEDSKTWSCCRTAQSSPGCTESPGHVFKTTDPARLSTVLPFAETPENAAVPADRAVAFDCEMVYTVHGMELGRLTATAWPSGEMLLDVLVRPAGEILDLNTRWSGISVEDMANAEPWTDSELPPPVPSDGAQAPRLKMVSSPAAARALLFALISPSTPLVGHGLENDLNAARVIHPTLVDTVLLFPHRRGLPLRRALRHLAEEHLGRLIQQGGGKQDGGRGEGHDSAEDARAAGDLARVKVGEKWAELRRKGWTFSEEGGLVEPGVGKSA